LPIQYALTFPERLPPLNPRLDLARIRQMTFMAPDMEKFRCLPLAYRALTMGGSAPAVLNAANEVAVQLFLEGRLSFAEIPAVIEEALNHHTVIPSPTLDDLIRIDRSTRSTIVHAHASTA
jgi:1-deoxy-D-xylulose-5-phosphate reductoisomerase